MDFRVKTMGLHNSKERERFWEAYRGCAEENRVRPDRSPFYVSWVKAFANFLPEKPLKDRSRKDIEAFSADLRNRRGRKIGTAPIYCLLRGLPHGSAPNLLPSNFSNLNIKP